jgi:DNA-binding CsgD family transcriptional regulator
VSLDDRMKRALLALELTAQGKAYSYAPVTAHAAPESMEPLGDADPPHLLYARRYAGCRTDAQREQVIEEATAELQAIQHTRAKPATETPSQREGRIIREGEGWHSREVAVAHRMLEREVWAIRRRHLRDKDYGRVVEDQKLSATDRVARVQQMKAEGMSARQIAFALRVDHKTVTSDLERAA